jgi:hypothetical protein
VAWWHSSVAPSEIVNSGTGLCLDATPADTKRADVVVAPCNDGISQRWFL